MQPTTRVSTALLLAVLAACGGDEATPDTEASATPAAGAEAAGAPAAAEPVRKYSAKSGIVETSSNAAGKMTMVVYFDDYGAREATYTTTEMAGFTVQSVTIVADGWQYEYDPETKKGKKWSLAMFGGAASRSNPMPELPDIAGMSPDQVAEMGISELPARTIAGKEAKGQAMNAAGMKVKVWMWEGIAMRTELDMGGKEPMVAEVTSISLGAPVPAEKFAIPADVTLDEVTL